MAREASGGVSEDDCVFTFYYFSKELLTSIGGFEQELDWLREVRFL